ncbi:HD-GYP domain-containing protein [Ethanoligenens harbinense]|uniref:Metal dependent phosphohydrolase n=1 Tax=Ethanoligenens harbinense (strain DSM 18485 / JCM 12961 / CGMCC 1.5033 / YUAN-3) TaxID=663278 RepID=E6U683_ETHHY|nr:HD domain-containing phosphohydrolase [Ethanoligenens harbinense]ADU26850.1 metal dependent phosphohydrolase [Ethanoligenens harbinense YUAN-3]AVQ95954.1 hypothetical protein CXQ68_06745 [Ethanoligenens harbinense YUAN-3]AYF41362.1 hypothetical protein CN246_06750 [Ethanoligenens harbinense]QCN92195.1 HD domain-containing protein [Ethanoligenens harbinense]
MQKEKAARNVLQGENLRRYPADSSIKNTEALFADGDWTDRADCWRNIIPLLEGLNRNVSFKETLDYIFNTFRAYIPYTHIGVALLDGKVIRGTYVATSPEHAGLAQKLRGYATDIRTTSLYQVIQSGQVRVINDLEAYLEGKPLRPYNRFLLEAGVRSSITFPLMQNEVPIGLVFFSSIQKNVYTAPHVQFLQILAGSLMFALERGILLENMVLTSTLSLAALTEERDVETGEHLLRIKRYSRLLAELLYQNKRFQTILDFKFIGDIERFSPLHDIGKVAIRDEILLKPGKLTPEEYRIMQTHTVYGAKVLRMADAKLKNWGRSMYRMGIEIAESHHEKWDGSGYPYGLNGEKIPLSARIVAVCDVFDALMSPRVYKRAYSFDETFEIMRKESAQHFDPVIFELFDKNKEAFRNLSNELPGNA